MNYQNQNQFYQDYNAYTNYNSPVQPNLNNYMRQMNEGSYYDREQEELRNNFGKMNINYNNYN